MIAYLVAVVLLSGICLVAVAPPMPRTSSRSNWTYTCGAFLANELPFVALFWLALWTVQAAINGGLTEPVGLVGAGVTVIGVVLVVIIARRGFGARAELAAAIAAAFDPMTATESGAARLAAVEMPRHHPWARIVFTPLSFKGPQVERVTNLPYGQAGRRNLLDVYHPRSARGGPVLVYLHGGGFRSGHKSREAKPLLHRLARHGWVTMSANYRLEPEAQLPDSVIDAKRALAWARHNAARYGGDASRIYVAGSSSGGYLAATCALTASHATLEPEGDEQDVIVAGAICLYGFYGALADPGGMPSPHAHVHAGAPPMFIAHGDLDTLVLVGDARVFAQEMAAGSSAPVVYAELRGAHHGFDIFRSARFEAVVDAIEVFVARTDPNHSSPPPST